MIIGKNYEKQSRKVSDSLEHLQKISLDTQILNQEYSYMSELSKLVDSLDDVILEGVNEVHIVGESAKKTLESEARTEDKNIEEIEQSIDEEIAKLQKGVERLKQFDESKIGHYQVLKASGAYEKQIRRYEELKSQLILKQNSDLMEEDYLSNVLKSMESSLDKTLDSELVFAGSQNRKLNSPSSFSSLGSVKGKWDGNTYILDDDYVPEKYNKERYTIKEIKENLYINYGIVFEGIPFEDGVADFSSVSVASISTAEIVANVLEMTLDDFEKKSQMEKAEDYRNVFSSAVDGKSKRNRNFDIADQIASEHEIDIPGLERGYTATELKNWRQNNKFSWDEQVNGGYNLVPSVIHGNVAHTGLVSTSSKAYDYINQYKEDIKSNPDKYSWDEDIAPVTIHELYNNQKGEK